MSYDTVGLYGTIWVSVMTFLSALFQLLGKPALSKFFGRLMGLDVGGYIRSFERWKRGRAFALAKKSTVLLTLLFLGCMPRVHSDIQKVIVFEQQVHSEALHLKSLADACIPALPADKQQAARDAVAKRFSQLTEVLSTKDALLQAALESSADSVNIANVAVEIMKSLDSIVSLLRTFGVASPELSRVEVRASVMRAKAGTL